MRHKFLVLTVKELLKSVYIYGSYRKIKTVLSLFLDHPVYVVCWQRNDDDDDDALGSRRVCTHQVAAFFA